MNCNNCKHFQAPDTCTHQRNSMYAVIEPAMLRYVTVNDSSIKSKASGLRADEYPHNCGPSGKWFDPVDEADLASVN